MMEIEYLKTSDCKPRRKTNTNNLQLDPKYHKTKHNLSSDLHFQDVFWAPNKQLRLSNTQSKTYHLSNAEKA